MQTAALQLHDLGSHVLAPAQQTLKPYPRPDPLTGKMVEPSKEGEDDIFFMGVMGALGLPAELHIGLVGAQIAMEEMDKNKLDPMPNLTTQSVSPNVSWASTSALQLQGETDAQKQAAAKKKKSFFGGLRFH
jgi:hypothetical protein